MLVGENIGEFGVLLANRQSFLPQIYGIFNIHLPLCQTFLLQYVAEFANVFCYTVCH